MFCCILAYHCKPVPMFKCEDAATGGMAQDDADQWDAYEEKLDELNEGLLEAYAAGFSKAKEVYDITKGPRDVQALMQTEGVSEHHYYYWDGRTKPLAPWLREQFGIDSDE